MKKFSQRILFTILTIALLLLSEAKAQNTISKNLPKEKIENGEGLPMGKNKPTFSQTESQKSNAASTSHQNNSKEKSDVIPDESSSKNVAHHRWSPRQIYQNVTVRYNYYYNARLKLNLAMQKVASSKPDDYTKILPLFTYDADATSVSGEMDEVIKKTSTGIQFHQRSVWKPDCYLLMGKAYYFKKEFADALEVFQYIETKFKIKTIKGVPQPTPKLLHQPITDQALIWLIKCYVQMAKFNEAEAIMANVDARKGFPLDLKNELKIMHADLYIKNKDYKNAVVQLNTANALTKDKKLHTRYTYITAQVYEANGEKKNAIKNYRQVLLMKPAFEMEYNARKKIVQLSIEIEKIPSNETKNMLLQMAADKRFKDMWDEIYYLLADIDLKQKNEKQGIADLKNSIFYSTINATQKGLSFEKLADIYYNRTQYILARNRYDSTLHYLTSAHEDYAPVKERKEVLDEVVAKIRIIQKEDSLQKLGSMSKADLEKKLTKMLIAKHKKELNDSLDKVTKQLANTDNKTNGQNDDDGGAWYFYNSAAKASGYTDFIRKWGNRQLGDNWRRNNKQAVAISTDKDKDKEKEEDKKEKETKKDGEPQTELEKALANIPVSDEQKKKSDEKVVNAYFDLANLYKSKLKNDKRAIETFEKLLTKYPVNKYEQETYYNLYLLYGKQPNLAKAEFYRDKILNKFPNSNFAKAIKDPDFAKKQSGSQVALNQYYEATYNMYLEKQYADVIPRCAVADTMSKTNKFKPMFDFMKALCIGKTQEQPVFVASLQKIIGDYPNHDVKKKAQELLTLINNPRKEKPVENKIDDAKSNTVSADAEAKKATPKQKAVYVFNPESPHYVLIYFAKVSSKNTTISGRVSNYNSKQHSLDNIDVAEQMLNAKTQLMRIKSFKNMNEAADYLDEIDTKNALFKPLTPNDYQAMLISEDNFQVLVKDADIDNYVRFYEESYNK